MSKFRLDPPPPPLNGGVESKWWINIVIFDQYCRDSWRRLSQTPSNPDTDGGCLYYVLANGNLNTLYGLIGASQSEVGLRCRSFQRPLQQLRLLLPRVAVHCISAAFAVVVLLLHGWVSVTFVYCVETAKDTASCYGVRIGNRTQAFEWYHFQWHWVILADLAKIKLHWSQYTSL